MKRGQIIKLTECKGISFYKVINIYYIAVKFDKLNSNFVN